MLADTYWEIENPLESVSKFMTCNAKPSSGTVPANERAINIAFATFVTKLSCQLTEDGRIEMLRRRKDRESRKVDFIGVPIPYTSDALLKAQSAVRDILAKAKAGAGALPTTPLDSGLSAQTDSAINAGRAASDGEIAAGNSQVLQTAQSIAQQSFEQRARERQAATTGSGNYPAPFPAPLNGFAQPYSGAVGGGSSQPSQPVKEAVSEAHNPANEASSCITPIYKPSFAANRVSSIMGAVFRNSCGYSVEVTWCVTGADCNPGYSNVGTVMGNSDRGISFDASRPGSINYAACRIGFTRAQGALSPTFQHACK